MKNKKLFISVLSIVSLVLLIVGGTYAFWVWELDNENYTNIAFTSQGKDFSCSADGGGNITSNDISLRPTVCTDSDYVIVREINTTMVNNAAGNIRLDLWLNINSFATELANSTNFKWALTTSNEGCTKGTIINEGNFKSKTAGDKVYIMSKNYDTSSNDTYYLYIWLDDVETDPSTANKSFNFSLSGECSDSYIQKPYINNSGLIPVKLSDTGDTVTAISEDNPDWYDYYNKKWANAVLVESTNRSNYQNLSGNTEVNIPTSEILAYYVWIPRYSYKVWQYSGASSTGQEHEIDIKFVSRDTKEIATGNGEWYTHPAFWWDNDSDGVREDGEEISGIWVGKFETSHKALSIDANNTTGNNLGTCTEDSCTNYSGLRILPNVRSLRYNTVARFFYAARHMEDGTYGLDSAKVDSHMLKNSEWGAVAYLSHSRYGINEEVRVNNQNAYTTACGAATANASGNATCSNKYAGTVTVFPQSTTGNVTGVFDMSGGAHEYVMGMYKEGKGSSEFTNLPDKKYYNNYPSPPFNNNQGLSPAACTLEYSGGHALGETNNWYSDKVYFANPSYYWFIRGQVFSSNDATSGVFSYNATTGASADTVSFRLTIVEE